MWIQRLDPAMRRLDPAMRPRAAAVEEPPPGPGLLQTVVGLALAGSPWEWMLPGQGYPALARVRLGPAGDFLFMQSPAVVREVLVDKAEVSFPLRYSVPLFEQLGLDRGIVYEQGERHRRHKSQCLPSFEQARSMEYFISAIKAETALVAGEWQQRHQGQRGRRSSGVDRREVEPVQLDLYEESRKLTLEVVLRVTFGTASFARSSELSDVIGEYLTRIVATANEIPPWWQIDGRLSGNFRRVTGYLLPALRDLVGEVIAARRAELEAQELDTPEDRRPPPADLLGVLLSSSTGGGTLSDEDILSVLFDLVIAGSDTTASTIAATLFLLHTHEDPDVLRRAVAEASILDSTGLAAVEDVASALPYLTACCKETLRLYPPVPFIGRRSVSDAEVAGFHVEKGSVLCWSPWFLGRDAREWVRPSEFRPERWDPQEEDWWLAPAVTRDQGVPNGTNSMARAGREENAVALSEGDRRNRHPFAWLPFGAGPRGCLGTRLGLNEAVVATALLLKDFHFEFDRAPPLRFKYDLTLNLEGSCTAKVTPREGRYGGP